MDITAKYRAKQPPKEHEEAVRMLLEGITNANSKMNHHDSREVSSNSYEFDGRSLNSSNTSGIEATTNIINKNASYLAKNQYSTMRSKATLTSDDSTSSSGIDHDVTSKEPIPSRTIAVQCDLKSSSLKHDNLIDRSMQASSISSTKYGFYSFSPEILESRRHSQNSTSSKDIDVRSHLKSQIEAPTSMSDLSFSRSASDDEGNFKERYGEGSALLKTTIRRTSSRMDEGATATARARISSLPRRPLTAMSYVSTSRLRDQASPNRLREQRQHNSSRNLSRAVSQQTLTKPRIRANPVRLDSNSDSESNSSQVISVGRNQRANYDAEPQMENIFVTKQFLATPVKPPRPTLVSSMHNEQVCDYRTLRGVNSELKTQNLERYFDNTNLAYRVEDNLNPTYVNRRMKLSDQQQESRFRTRDEDNSIYSDEARYPIIDSYQNRDANVIKTSHPSLRNAETNKMNSMSLSRSPRHLKPRQSDYDGSGPTSGYCTINRKPYKISKDRCVSSQNPSERQFFEANLASSSEVKKRIPSTMIRNDTSRSHLSRQMNRQEVSNETNTSIDQRENYLQRQDPNLNQPNLLGRASIYKQREFKDSAILDSDSSGSPQTKTWANPNAGPIYNADLYNHGRKSSRSYSMRNISKADYNDEFSGQENLESKDEIYYRSSDKNNLSSHKSGFEFQTEDTTQERCSQMHSTNYDSRQQLTDIDHQDVNSVDSTRLHDTSASYLGISNHRSCRPQNPIKITGRAMSQQSLTRPTMPLSTARRRGASNSGSEVGGSSMSLMSRLNGRYENAHTRTPVVMYIPQVSSSKINHSGEFSNGRVGTIRKSVRSRQKSSSQDRSRRSLSRNGSDSESSSMLRTLVKPRMGRLQTNLNSKRYSRANNTTSNYDEDYEDTDGVAQLASELDTYKFRRRYSVPKDAKINWFSKLRQRVSSGGK